MSFGMTLGLPGRRGHERKCDPLTLPRNSSPLRLGMANHLLRATIPAAKHICPPSRSRGLAASGLVFGSLYVGRDHGFPVGLDG